MVIAEQKKDHDIGVLFVTRFRRVFASTHVGPTRETLPLTSQVCPLDWETWSDFAVSLQMGLS